MAALSPCMLEADLELINHGCLLDVLPKRWWQEMMNAGGVMGMGKDVAAGTTIATRSM